MRTQSRAAAGLLVVAGAMMAVLLGLSCGGESGGDGASEYDVSMQFNTEATQEDIDEVAAFLRRFDDDLEFLILEIFPPIGNAKLTTDVSGFCETVETELETRSYVESVSCGPSAPDGEPVDPYAPVSTAND